MYTRFPKSYADVVVLKDIAREIQEFAGTYNSMYRTHMDVNVLFRKRHDALFIEGVYIGIPVLETYSPKDGCIDWDLGENTQTNNIYIFFSSLEACRAWAYQHSDESLEDVWEMPIDSFQLFAYKGLYFYMEHGGDGGIPWDKKKGCTVYTADKDTWFSEYCRDIVKKTDLIENNI